MKTSITYPKSYIVWDLETTGFDPKECKIIEIGAMKIVDGEVVTKKNWILNHGVEIPENITEITTITQEMVDMGVDPMVAMKEFLEEFVRGSEFNLTHNGFRFDIPFLLAAMTEEQKVEYGETIINGCLDSAVIYKARALGMDREEEESFNQFAGRIMSIWAKGVKYNVGHCCTDLGVDTSMSQFHRALGDVFLTNEIYKKLT